MKGYMGKVLIVDLTNGTTGEQQIDDEVYEGLLSGVGLGAYMLFNNIPPGTDPLGPDNMLGFVSGLLAGTGSLMTGRWMAVCKSPLTGGWGDANCGGTLAPAIKHCGYDGIFVKGVSRDPVYLLVDDGGPQLRDASHLWGRDAIETEEVLEHEVHSVKRPSIAAIGQSGEKLSLISGICNDKGRIAARSGVGAVMGSKKLKAVVLADSKPITCQQPEAIKRIGKEYADRVKNAELPGILRGWMLPFVSRLMSRSKTYSEADGFTYVPILKRWGTGMGNAFSLPNGDSPIKNWSGSAADLSRGAFSHVNPDRVIKRETSKYRCSGCVIGCGGICDIKDVTGAEYAESHKLEYETVNAFGALLLNTDLDAIFYVNELLNRAGMDSISAGSTVAFAVECFENGILSRDDTDGLDLTWGNTEAIRELVKKMVDRVGIGDILADGVRVAAQKIGKGSERFAMHVGGQEAGMHDPRHDPILGIHFCADPTPGRHTVGSRGNYNYTHLWEFVTWAPKVMKNTPLTDDYLASEEVALKSVAMSCIKQVLDGAGGCLFAMISGLENWRVFDYLNAATGWNKTPDEYMLIGKRVQTLRQMFNVRQGVDPTAFKMPDRLAGVPPLKTGVNAGKTIPIEAMVKRHWQLFGWDRETGIPLPETIQELGLDRLVKEGPSGPSEAAQGVDIA
jgi:aldehyde:ferredoxin oxidoreductase